MATILNPRLFICFILGSVLSPVTSIPITYEDTESYEEFGFSPLDSDDYGYGQSKEQFMENGVYGSTVYDSSLLLMPKDGKDKHVCSTIDFPSKYEDRSGVYGIHSLWTRLFYYIEPYPGFTYSKAEGYGITIDMPHIPGVSVSFGSNEIYAAIKILRKIVPCLYISQLEKPKEEYYVHIYTNSDRCSATVGPSDRNIRYMRLTKECRHNVRHILHELFHVLGVVHEQNRSDRDEYVRINFENMPKSCEHNFNKADESKFTTYGTRYNRHSIMHYSSHECSKNNRPTISFKNNPLEAPDEPYNKDGVQWTDVIKLRAMYC